MRIHLYLGVIVILVSFLFGLSAIEIAILCCVISFVLIAEIVNTALEVNLDYLNHRKFNPTIKIIKDIVAGVVLVASINAVVVGSVIFTPYLHYYARSLPSATEFKRPKNKWHQFTRVLCLLPDEFRARRRRR